MGGLACGVHHICMQWPDITSQKAWMFSNTTVLTSNHEGSLTHRSTDTRLFLFNHGTTFLWVLRFSLWCDWGLWCCGMCHGIIGWLVACVLKRSIALHYHGSNVLWRIPSKRWEPPAQQHSITSQRAGIIKLYFTHLRQFLITRCWSDWYRIPGIRNCSGRTGLRRWVCCQT